MGKIDKFLAKPQEITLGDEQYMVKPFTVNELPLLTRMGSKDDTIKSKAIQELVFEFMKQIDPEATREQTLQIEISFLEEIMDAIGKINDMEMDEAKTKLLEKLNAAA